MFLALIGNPHVLNQAPQVDDIGIEHHPYTKLPAKTFLFSYFSHSHFPAPPVPNPNRDPRSLFQTLLDFEVTKLVLEVALNKDQTECLIKLLQQVHGQPEKFTIENYADMQETWDTSEAHLTLVDDLFSTHFRLLF